MVMGCGQKSPVQLSGQAFKRKLLPLLLLSPTLQVGHNEDVIGRNHHSNAGRDNILEVVEKHDRR